MTRSSLQQTLALAGATGLRSFAGPSALAVRHGGLAAKVLPLMAVGEMLADKSPAMGPRIDPLPLAGRAVMGAVVGCVVARQEGQSEWAGAALGAAVAVLAAHLGYQFRKHAPLPNVAAGLAEDAVALGACAWCGDPR